jgi:hypothetical protein
MLDCQQVAENPWRGVRLPPPPPAFAKASAGKPEDWRRLSAEALAKEDLLDAFETYLKSHSGKAFARERLLLSV